MDITGKSWSQAVQNGFFTGTALKNNKAETGMALLNPEFGAYIILTDFFRLDHNRS